MYPQAVTHQEFNSVPAVQRFSKDREREKVDVSRFIGVEGNRIRTKQRTWVGVRDRIWCGAGSTEEGEEAEGDLHFIINRY